MAASADDYEFTVRWRPFLLRPSMPLEGKAKEPLVAVSYTHLTLPTIYSV